MSRGDEARAIPDYMGSADDALTDFLARVDAWNDLRQPSIATAAEHKKRDAQEREAGFRLNNAASLLAWFFREGHASLAVSQPTGAMPGRESLRKCLSGMVSDEPQITRMGTGYVVHDLNMKRLPRVWDDRDDAYEALTNLRIDAILALLTLAPSATGEAGNE